MTTLAEKLDQLVRESGLSSTAVSVSAGLGKTAVRDIVEGRSRRPTFHTLSQIAAALGVPAEALFEAAAAHPGLTSPKLFRSSAPPARGGVGKAGIPAGNPLAGAPSDRTLPIRGIARGGVQGSFQVPVDEPPFDWTFRPPQLAHVKDAYAVMMVGTSMYPRYREGTLLWVNPSVPTPIGCDVLGIFHDDRAFVKELTRRTSTHLIVRQYGDEPGELPPIPLSDIRALHRIVGCWHV